MAGISSSDQGIAMPLNPKIERDDNVEASARETLSDSSSSSSGTPPKQRKRYRKGDHLRSLVDSQMKRIKFLQIEPEIHQQKHIEQDFENLARQLELSKIRGMERLYKELQKELKEMKLERNGKEKKRRLVDVEQEIDPQRRLWKKVLEIFAKRKIPKEMKDLFFQRLVVKMSKPKNTTSDVITKQAESDIVLLQLARKVAAEHPMFWSREWRRKIRKVLKKRKAAEQLLTKATGKDDPFGSLSALSSSSEAYTAKIRSPALQELHSKITEEQQYEEAAEFQARMQERLSNQQYQNLMNYVRDYVESCEEPIIGTVPSHATGDSDEDDAENDEETGPETNDAGADSPAIPFPDILTPVSTDDIVKQTTPKKHQHVQQELRILKSNLLKFIPDSRFNLIAQDVSDFFYVTASDEVVDSTLGADQLTAIIQDDRIVRTSQTRWDEARETYVKCFQQIHKILLKVKAEMPPLIDDNDVATNSPEDSILETIAAVAASTLPDAQETAASTERVRPRRYIAFEAMEIGQPVANMESDEQDIIHKFELSSTIHLSDEKQIQVFESDAFPTHAPTDRIVFIDNLPIDIGRDQLLNAYSRCGEIDALELFHYRPELDPGRKSIDDHKKIRSPSSSSRRQQWQRPRTPLYGMLLYKEAEGAAKAVSDPLRIFGMVLDKHLIRSHRATDMTKLYLEDVNPTHDITAIEYDLSRILHPELYVCLDVSAHRRRRRRVGKDLESLSCVIQLSSFEAAYWAYQKLHMELEYLQEDNSNCVLHWMETPADAMLYWTRQLNY
jgi:hypothetical protein